MRLNLPAYFIALALISPMLAGCLIACRKDRDVQRNNANARADKRQRDLGEDMMNHPNIPNNNSR
jgi:hypothetical protein